MNLLESIEIWVSAIKRKNPLILNITNYVTMDLVASVLLALGASPIMSICEDEYPELVKMSDCVSINIGTLDQKFIERARIAINLAKYHNKPIVLDPTGSGATKIRTEVAREFASNCNIIRGNASEVMSLFAQNINTHGVDTSHTTSEAEHAALSIANLNKCVVVASGAVDIITDGSDVISLNFGNPIMKFVTGMGCALNASIAAFAAVDDCAFDSAKIGVAYFSICGQIASNLSAGPGDFRSKFIDTIYKADFAAISDIVWS